MNKDIIFYDEKIMEEDQILSEKIYRILKFIEDTIREQGEISQFKEDVMYVIHFLLEKTETKNLTVTEMVLKQKEYEIAKAKEKLLEKRITEQQRIINSAMDYIGINDELMQLCDMYDVNGIELMKILRGENIEQSNK